MHTQKYYAANAKNIAQLSTFPAFLQNFPGFMFTQFTKTACNTSYKNRSEMDW